MHFILFGGEVVTNHTIVSFILFSAIFHFTVLNRYTLYMYFTREDIYTLYFNISKTSLAYQAGHRTQYIS